MFSRLNHQEEDNLYKPTSKTARLILFINLYVIGDDISISLAVEKPNA